MNIDKISRGDNFPEEVNAIIEIPQNSYVKYEVDKESDAIFVDRFMYTTMSYPFNYGFVPHTKADDGDPADIFVLSSYILHPGVVIPARPIGLLEMEDEAGMDHKIIAVPSEKVDPFHAHIKDISDLEDATKAKIKHFFEYYKELEPGKWVKLKEFAGKDRAIEELNNSI